jgi:hypothetical protein
MYDPNRFGMRRATPTAAEPDVAVAGTRSPQAGSFYAIAEKLMEPGGRCGGSGGGCD